MGVFQTTYATGCHQLRPGDKLLLYTDGMDGAAFGECAKGVASLLACAEGQRGLPIQQLVPRLATELFPGRPPADDLTLLGLEMLR